MLVGFAYTRIPNYVDELSRLHVSGARFGLAWACLSFFASETFV